MVGSGTIAKEDQHIHKIQGCKAQHSSLQQIRSKCSKLINNFILCLKQFIFSLPKIKENKTLKLKWKNLSQTNYMYLCHHSVKHFKMCHSTFIEWIFQFSTDGTIKLLCFLTLTIGVINIIKINSLLLPMKSPQIFNP